MYVFRSGNPKDFFKQEMKEGRSMEIISILFVKGHITSRELAWELQTLIFKFIIQAILTKSDNSGIIKYNIGLSNI